MCVCVCVCVYTQNSQLVQWVNNLPASAGDVRDTGSILGLGWSPGGGHGNPLQYSCLERGTWWATVHGVAKSWTQMKWLCTHSCFIYVDIILHSVNTVYDICWFAYDELFLHPRNNSHLIMVWFFTYATGFGLQVFFFWESLHIYSSWILVCSFLFL